MLSSSGPAARSSHHQQQDWKLERFSRLWTPRNAAKKDYTSSSRTQASRSIPAISLAEILTFGFCVHLCPNAAVTGPQWAFPLITAERAFKEKLAAFQNYEDLQYEVLHAAVDIKVNRAMAGQQDDFSMRLAPLSSLRPLQAASSRRATARPKSASAIRFRWYSSANQR